MPLNPIATFHYQAFKPWMGVPVAISQGTPRWMPGLDKIAVLAPTTAERKEPSDFKFREMYKERLDREEEKVKRELLRLSEKYPGQRLVLLCWEDLSKPNSEMCHRTTFAEWIRDRDIVVEEVDPRQEHDEPAPAEPKAPDVPTLF